MQEAECMGCQVNSFFDLIKPSGLMTSDPGADDGNKCKGY